MPSPLLCWFKIWTPCFSISSCLYGLLPSGVLPLSVSKSCPSLQDCWRVSVPPGAVHTCCDAVANCHALTSRLSTCLFCPCGWTQLPQRHCLSFLCAPLMSKLVWTSCAAVAPRNGYAKLRSLSISQSS